MQIPIPRQIDDANSRINLSLIQNQHFMKYVVIKISILTVCSLILLLGTSSAQISWCDDGVNLITGLSCSNTTAPFLRVTPDARSASMGDAGITTSTDANALHFNSSKLAFAEYRFGFSANYTPLLRDFGVRSFRLFYLTNYVRLDEQQTVGVGLRYFDMGRHYSDTYQMDLDFRRREYELAVSYNRKLNEQFAAGLNLKYINSRLVGDDNPDAPIRIDAQAIAVDLSFTYKTPLTDALELTVGSAVTNLGSKMAYTYDITASNLPTNLGIGSGIKWEINDLHSFHFALDVNRLIVPSPSNGFAEKMRENRYSFGTEYRYKRFAARIGHLNEHKTQGGMKTLTYGIGFNNKFARLNLSYLHTLNWYRYPMNKTLRVSLVLDFGNA